MTEKIIDAEYEEISADRSSNTSVNFNSTKRQVRHERRYSVLEDIYELGAALNALYENFKKGKDDAEQPSNMAE